MAAKRPKGRGMAGLRLNVVRGPHRDDAGLWYWRVIDNRGGRRETLWSGWARAREAEQELVRLAAGGAVEADAEPVLETVGHVLRAWLAHLEDDRADLAPRTVIVYRSCVRRLLKLLDDSVTERFGVAAVERWVGAALRQWSPKTVDLDQLALRAAWAWARQRGYAPDRDLPRQPIAIPKTAKRTPTDAEVARVIERIERPWVQTLLRLQWATGARIGEIATLTWDRVDWSRGELHLRGKTGPRSVPVSAATLEMLRRWRLHVPADRSEVLGVAASTARAQCYEPLHAACEAAKIPGWSTHALRRAVVDRLARAGVDVATAADLLGHSPEVMLDIYRQVSDADRRRAVARARLGALPEGDVIEADFGRTAEED